MEDVQWTKICERAGDPPAAVFACLAPCEPESSMTFHEFGSQDELQLAEPDYLPHAEAAVREHDDDEAIYVVSGELHIGNKQRYCKPVRLFIIAGNTYYGVTAAPGGRTVNFRA